MQKKYTILYISSMLLFIVFSMGILSVFGITSYVSDTIYTYINQDTGGEVAGEFTVGMTAGSSVSLNSIQHIIVDTSWKNDPAVLVALSDLKLALKNIYGKNLSIENSGGSLPANSIAILKKENSLVSGSIKSTANGLKKEGHVIRADGSNIIITGKDILGTVFGTMYFIERFKLDNDRTSWSISREPDFPIRIAHGTTSEKDCLRLGINYVVVGGPWSEAGTFGGKLTNSIALGKIGGIKSKIRSGASSAKRYHLGTVVTSDAFTVPDGYMNDKVNLLRNHATEVFNEFRNIDIWQVGFGRGYHERSPPIGFDTENVRGSDISKALVALGGVAKNMGKKILVRTWADQRPGLGSNPKTAVCTEAGQACWHTNPSGYLDYTSLARSQNLPIIYRFKPVHGDYGRYQTYNGVLGAGGDQGIEWQTHREHEGNCIFPNYLGSVYLRGREELIPFVGASEVGGVKRMLADGVVLHNNAASQKGFWERANSFALSRSLWNVNATEDVLAKEWIALELGLEVNSPVVQKFGQALNLSGDIARDIHYMESYARNGWKGVHQMVNVKQNASLTEKYAVFGYNTRLQRDVGFKKDSDIEQKRRAVQNVNEFLSIINSIKNNIPNKDLGQAGNSLGQAIYNSSLMYKYWTYTFKYYIEGLIRNEQNNTAKTKEALKDWKVAWNFYDNQIVGNSYGHNDSRNTHPKLIDADFGARMRNGEKKFSYVKLYTDGGMVGRINQVKPSGTFMTGIYPQKLLLFSKFSGIEFEAYVGVPSNAQSGTKYLVAVDITNVGGFHGESNDNITNLKVNLKVGGSTAGTIIPDDNSVSGRDIPVIVASNWTPTKSGAVTATLEFDYNGQHYVLNGSEPYVPPTTPDPDPYCGDGVCDSDENNSTCPGDCGEEELDPPPTQTCLSLQGSTCPSTQYCNTDYLDAPNNQTCCPQNHCKIKTADLNCSDSAHKIGFKDLTVLIAYWGEFKEEQKEDYKKTTFYKDCEDSTPDLNGDGKVDIDDFALFLNQWGK